MTRAGSLVALLALVSCVAVSGFIGPTALRSRAYCVGGKGAGCWARSHGRKLDEGLQDGILITSSSGSKGDDRSREFWQESRSSRSENTGKADITTDCREAKASSTSPPPSRTTIPTDVAVVGAPQQVVEKEYSIEAILKELAEIQNQGPKNYCVLGTRHCSFLHQQIIELLAYALVLSGNHVFTSGALGTNAATIRGALRAEREELLTVVLPQSLEKQSEASRELIRKVTNVITNGQNDHLPLDVASRLCNSDLLSRTDQLICFAFHDSNTIIETSREARSLDMIVTELYLD